MAIKKYTKSNSQRKNYNFVDPLNPPPEQRIDATGGTITSAGAYKIHTFTTAGTFTVTQGSFQEIDYLMIGGGGAAGRGNGSGACGGAGGGALMNWLGLANTYSQCIGPKIYAQSGDVFSVNIGSGGAYTDNNSLQNSGGDSWILKNNIEHLRVYGGGAGGGGSSAHVGYNGGCGGGSAGTGGNGTNQWQSSSTSILTGEYQYQFNFGRSTWPFKQGNGNNVLGFTSAQQLPGASGGAWTPGPRYWTLTTDTIRGAVVPQSFPGYGFKTSFGGTYLTYGNAGYCGTQYGVAGKPPDPSEIGSGGHSMITTGASGNGSAGQVIFRYLTNKTVAAANVEILIVGGGGGGGGTYRSAGGGAGSVIYYGNESSNTGGPVTLYNGTYPVVVGAGGVLSTSATSNSLGTASSVIGIPCNTVTYYGIPAANTFGSFDAYAGGSKARSLGELHGSGHGTYSATGAAWDYGLPAPGHGNKGGLGAGSAPASAGGGGGAGAVGTNASVGTGGGAGGIGKQYSISGTATYYGGGGGGAASSTGGVAVAGGLGGGGAGVNGPVLAANNGAPNTGGGAGGTFSGTTGGTGGSGIVIIRYPSTYPAANGTTGSPTVVVSGGWRTYTFTQSGSISFG